MKSPPGQDSSAADERFLSRAQISGKGCAPGLNAGSRGELVGDGAAVAGHGGRGGVDLLDQQGQGAGDAGGGGPFEADGDRGGGAGDGAGQAADDGFAGDGAVFVVVAQVGVEVG